MEAKWIKLDTGLFDNTKIKLDIEPLPNRDSILIVWFKLLCLCANGCDNVEGKLLKPNGKSYSVEELAIIFNRDLETVKQAIEIFLDNKMLSFEPKTKCYFITNWNERQDLSELYKRVENKKARDREYQRNRRLVARQSHDEESDNRNIDKNRIEEDKNREENNNEINKYNGENEMEITPEVEEILKNISVVKRF